MLNRCIATTKVDEEMKLTMLLRKITLNHLILNSGLEHWKQKMGIGFLQALLIDNFPLHSMLNTFNNFVNEIFSNLISNKKNAIVFNRKGKHPYTQC